MAVKKHTCRLLQEWSAPTDPPRFSTKEWHPKNPEIECPTLDLEFPLPWPQWNTIKFPSFSVPEAITTHVNTAYWFLELSRISSSPDSEGAAKLMETVFVQLKDGADSMVGPPGTKPTVSENWFSSPQVDLPRMMDSLATEVKHKHMAGPLPPGSVIGAKVNSFMAVPKPSGDRRQVP